ncbi:MAG: lipid II flippase MurJ [Arcanobacterium sp.]|nr:lipid II flippase MurJ [Arcanobacterium sp.]
MTLHNESTPKPRKVFLAGALGAAGTLAILTVLSRVFGLFRKLSQSWAVSDGAVATAYDTANTVPNVLFEVAAGGALAGAVIPLISRYLVQKNQRAVDQLASALLNWVLLIGIPVALFVVLTAKPIALLLFGAEADPQILALATMLLRLFAVQVPLYGISVVLTGILQVNNRFIMPALAPLFSSLAIIGMFYVYAQLYEHSASPSEIGMPGSLLLGLGTSFGVLLFALPQFIPARKLFQYHFTLKFPDDTKKDALKLSGAGLAALFAQQIAIFAVMYFANHFGGVGTFTTYSYAFAIFMVPYGVLAVPVATVLFPKISRAQSAGDFVLATELVAKSTRIVFIMGAASACLLYALADSAKLVLELGRDIEALELAMQFLAPALVGYSVLYHGARVFYALGHPRRVIITNSVAWTAVIGSLLISALFGETGREYALQAIGISFTVGLTIGLIVHIFNVQKVLGSPGNQGVLVTFVFSIFVFPLFAIIGEGISTKIFSVLGETISAALLNAGVIALVILVLAGAITIFTERFFGKSSQSRENE